MNYRPIIVELLLSIVHHVQYAQQTTNESEHNIYIATNDFGKWMFVFFFSKNKTNENEKKEKMIFCCDKIPSVLKH